MICKIPFVIRNTKVSRRNVDHTQHSDYVKYESLPLLQLQLFQKYKNVTIFNVNVTFLRGKNIPKCKFGKYFFCEFLLYVHVHVHIFINVRLKTIQFRIRKLRNCNLLRKQIYYQMIYFRSIMSFSSLKYSGDYIIINYHDLKTIACHTSYVKECHLVIG